MSIDDSVAPPFFPGGRMRAGPPPEKRFFAKHSVATILVVLIHILFFFFFAISILQETGHRKNVKETILYLPSLGNDHDSHIHMITPDVKTNQAPAFSIAPQATPRILVQPEEQPTGSSATPGDILGAVGQTLACSAGSWEHLTLAEQDYCRHIPWRGARTPRGNIVMLPQSVLPRLKEAPQEYRMTGADALQQGLRTGGSPCQIMQQTPCLNDVLHPTTDPGIAH